MCPRTPNSPVLDLYEALEIPDEPEIVPPYFCQRGSGYIHSTIPATICTGCYAHLIFEKSDEWSLIRFHQLTIRQPIYIVCKRCNKKLHEPREGYHCRICTTKFIEYLNERGIPPFQENDKAIIIEAEKIERLELY